MKRLRLLVLLALALMGAFAAVAHADYRAGSTHRLLAHHRRLALPLPRATSLPKLTEAPSGRMRIATTARYRAANWKGRGKARRDRVTVTIAVARRLLAAGPDPSTDVFRKTIRHRLLHREVTRHYSVLLPTRVSKLLKKWGALSPRARVRARALRRVTVDIQQDRDYRRVDGRYDWREGGAWSAADTLLARLHSHGRTDSRVELSSYRAPSGTLTLVNNTAAGVYCERGCPLVDGSGEPGTIDGTSNSAEYRTPIAVAGGPVQCFDQGSNGSDPEGFDNADPETGEPRPYLPGELKPGAGEEGLPNTTGTAVTEGLAADYTLAWASEDELADETGLISGSVKLGLVLAGAAAKSAVTASVSFISPGAVTTDVLAIFEYFLENSCKEQGNYFNITGAEPNGGTFSQIIEAKNESWAPYAGTEKTPYGTQLNPSQLGYEKRPLRLDPVAAITPGLADNACIDCSANNVVEMSWDGYDPCPANANCAGEPPPTPIVQNAAAELDCGTGNAECPFPAAGFPSTPKPVFLGLSNGELLTCNATRVTECSKLDDAGNNYIASLSMGSGVSWPNVWAGISNGVVWECPTEIVNACGTMGEGGKHTGVNTVVQGSGHAYAGYSNGNIFSCNEGLVPGCITLDSAQGPSINALAVAPGGALIAARADGILWSCSPTVANDCTTLDSALSPILTLAQGPGNTVYAGVEDGVVWQCSTVEANACKTLGTAPSPVESVAYANGYVFAGFGGSDQHAEPMWRCTPGQIGSCVRWGDEYPTRLAAVGQRLYAGTGDYLYLCSTTSAGECEQLDGTGSYKLTIDSIAASGEDFTTQP